MRIDGSPTMEHPLKTTIDRLPELLQKNAPTMMRRMVARMKAGIARDDLAGDLSHGGLFLRVGEEDLVLAFADTIKEAFAPRERGRFDSSILMSLELEDEKAAVADPFESSTASFQELCKTAQGLGIQGTERYRKDTFVAAMKDAFAHSRMDAMATEQLMPHAKAALNAELAALYTQLEAISRRPAA
jgi:hypothetical protein